MQQQKLQISAELKCPAKQEKSEISQLASDVKLTEAQCSSDVVLAYTQHNVSECRCNASCVSSKSSTLDRMRELGFRDKALDSRGKDTDEAIVSSSGGSLFYKCRTTEPQHLPSSIRPRSLEVTKNLKVNIQGYQYENLDHVFGIPPRAASGNCLDIGNKEDTKEVESLAAVSAAVTTMAGKIPSSASVDTAIGCTTRKDNHIDLMSYRLAYNSVELESTAQTPVCEHCFHEHKEAEMISNLTAHCSRQPGEISLLNKDLLKHSTQNTRSVSMPIDIVSARHLPPDQRTANPLASGVSTTTPGQGQELQPTCSTGCSVPPTADAKALRKRAYRVGLNLFNR